MEKIGEGDLVEVEKTREEMREKRLREYVSDHLGIDD
jgi:hypothetical protein